VSDLTRRFTERQAREFVEATHRSAHAQLLAAFEAGCAPHRPSWHRDPTLPSLEITDSVYQHCGLYQPELNRCSYSLAYCVMAGDEYIETIVHEVAHAFVHFAWGDCCTVHGAEFMRVMRLAGRDTSSPQARDDVQFHRYPVLAAERLAEELVAERLSRGGVRNDMKLGTLRRQSLAERQARRSAMQ
jgi:hypothetical protein